MKTQIKRLSPHQNGKIFGIVMALSSLVLVIPMTVLLFMVPPHLNPQGQPGGPRWFIFLLLPIIYLISGYIMTAIGCVIYNYLFKYFGGIEYEVRENGNASDPVNSLLKTEPQL